MAGTDVYSSDQGTVPYHWLYATCPNDTALIDGDTNAGGKPYNIFDALLEVANYYKDPYLQAESLRRGVKRFARTKPVDFLLFYDPSVKPGDIAKLPTSIYFPEPLGGMIARTGWTMGRDSETAVIEMKGAGYHFNNHMHLDAGAFQIYYRGHLAIDTGAYPKYGTPFDWNFNKRSISHNVMLAYDPEEKFAKGGNDGGQHFPNGGHEMPTLELLLEKARSGTVISHAMGPNATRPLYSYLRADLTPAYGQKMLSYQRHFVTINLDDPDRPAALLVYDRMKTHKPQTRKIWLLQTLAKPRDSQGRLIADASLPGDTGRLVCDTLLPVFAQTTRRCVGGPDGENPVFDKTWPIKINKHGTLTPFNNGYRTEIESTHHQQLDYFLNVMQIMDRSQAAILPTERLQLKRMDGVAIANWQVYFSRSEERVHDALSFTVKTKADKTNVLFAGLRTGQWYLVAHDKTDQAILCKVDRDASTLFIQLHAGRYTLSQDKPAAMLTELGSLDDLTPQKTGGRPSARAIVNGITVPLSQLSFDATQCLVDAVPIFQQAGAQVDVNRQRLKVSMGPRVMYLRHGQTEYVLNGHPMPLTSPLNLKKRPLMLPLSVIAGFLERKAKAQPIGNVVYLDSFPILRNTYPWYESITSNSDNPGHPAIDAADGDLETYFAAQGPQVELVMDLGSQQTVRGMKICWYRSNVRQAFFDIAVSNDKQKWNTVFSGKSAGDVPTGQTELFSFDPVAARYVKIIGKGNSQNAWNSICEAMVVNRPQ